VYFASCGLVRDTLIWREGRSESGFFTALLHFHRQAGPSPSPGPSTGVLNPAPDPLWEQRSDLRVAEPFNSASSILIAYDSSDAGHDFIKETLLCLPQRVFRRVHLEGMSTLAAEMVSIAQALAACAQILSLSSAPRSSYDHVLRPVLLR
jgi:hypothetical protein